MNELIAGIDLGTTNSVLAVVVDGEPKVIEIHGQKTMPSCVGIGPDGKLIVGQAARNQLVAAPESTVLSIKRQMGDEVRVQLGGKEFSPEEISACILRELKQEAEKSLGQPISKAVITVPAFFNERQRKATHAAGELAGLEVVRIVNEPTAAALAYRGGQDGDETMLVYDLGGGTFDVSLVVVENGVVEVKASHGDTHLGGDDFDQLLVNHALLEFQKQHNQDLHETPGVARRLKAALEKAKCQLSDEPFAKVREEYVSADRHLELEIQRHEYEEMIEHLIEKTLACVSQSLQDGNMSPKDIDKVMLVGGSTRTPLVHRLLAERLQTQPRWEIDPDLIVAMGAAIQGAIIAGQSHRSVLVDITPHTFSNAAIGLYQGYEELICCPIIRRNTPLPACKAEQFATVCDNQEEVAIRAFQGESALPEENQFIGELMVEGLSKVPAGNKVIVQFKLDLNGMLHVSATEKATGKSKEVVLDTRKKGGGLNLAEARENVESLFGSRNEIQFVQPRRGAEQGVEMEIDGEDSREVLTTAKDLRKRGEALLKTELNEDDAKEIRELIHQSATAIKEGEWNEVSDKNDALSDLLFYLEE